MLYQLLEQGVVCGTASARPHSHPSPFGDSKLRFRDPAPAERAKQPEAQLKSLTWKDWQVPPAGHSEVCCWLWKATPDGQPGRAIPRVFMRPNISEGNCFGANPQRSMN